MMCVINREAHSLFMMCVINREAHSLFIFFRSLEVHSNISASLNNYLLELTSLGVSNNPSDPPLVGTLPPLTNRRVKKWWGLLPQITMNHLGSNSIG